MTTKKAPTEANKPRNNRTDASVASKSKASQKALQEPVELSPEAKVAKLEKELVNTKKELQATRKSMTIEINYYRELWTASEQDLIDLEEEPWYDFIKYRVKRWFKEIFEVENVNV